MIRMYEWGCVSSVGLRAALSPQLPAEIGLQYQVRVPSPLAQVQEASLKKL